jgi:hypothetical protein
MMDKVWSTTKLTGAATDAKQRPGRKTNWERAMLLNL